MLRFIRRAQEVASWSKDPSLGVGCVFVDNDCIELASGFNGFPRGVADDERLGDRPKKLLHMVHAEANGICSAARKGHSLLGSTCFCTLFPCATCAGLLIQAGIWRLVYLSNPIAEDRWKDSNTVGRNMLREAKVLMERMQEGLDMKEPIICQTI